MLSPQRFRFRFLSGLLFASSVVGSGASHAAESAEGTVANVKSYLLTTVGKMKTASADFVKASGEYSALIDANGGDAKAAYHAEPAKLDALVVRMQEDYKAMDSYGYETIEGIVAGVGSLADYDIYLDAGVPAAEGPDDVAPVVLNLGKVGKIDREGSLFTHIIEPALWGGNPKWMVDAGTRKLPRPEVLAAAAKDVDKKIGELQKSGEAWKVSVEDCFGAMVVMTPTLSDYFEDWKESRFAEEKSGKFQAVSRISDMRGIMSSCAIMYRAVLPQVAAKDKALAKSVDVGFTSVLSFIDLLGEREKKGAIKEAEVDELAAQAKEKTDKLVPQIEQSAAVAGVKIPN